LQIVVEAAADVQIVAIQGSLDTNTSPEAQETLTGLIDDGATQIVTDFADVDYISSAGLRILLVAAKRLRSLGGEMRLCNLSPFVQEVFDISGFGVMFTVFDSREAALES
jgi:anti-anti-sigma factor